MNDSKTLIFIASDLRSGSTLLDHLISNHRDIESVGELRNLNYYLNFSSKGPGISRGWLCRCGKILAECSFWSQIIQEYRQKEGRELKDMETCALYTPRGINGIFIALLIFISPLKLKRKLIPYFYNNKRNKTIGQNCFKLLDIVSTTSRKDIIIDSSKRPEQLYAMLRAKQDNYTIKVIHLIRDGRGVCFSKFTRGKELGKETGFLRKVVNWVLINIRIWNLRPFFHEKDFIQVKYEDLCTDTEGVMREICEKLNLTFHSSSSILSDEGKHVIGGSPRKFHKDTKIRLDERWKAKMPISKRIVFGILAGLFNKKLGY